MNLGVCNLDCLGQVCGHPNELPCDGSFFGCYTRIHTLVGWVMFLEIVVGYERNAHFIGVERIASLGHRNIY